MSVATLDISKTNPFLLESSQIIPKTVGDDPTGTEAKTVPSIKTFGYCGITIPEDFLLTLEKPVAMAIAHYGMPAILEGIEKRCLRDSKPPAPPKGQQPTAGSEATKEEPPVTALSMSAPYHITIVGPREWNKTLKKKDVRGQFLDRLREILASTPIVFSGLGHQVMQSTTGPQDSDGGQHVVPQWALYACVDRECEFARSILTLRSEFGLTEPWYPHATLAFNVQDLHVDSDGQKLNKSLPTWPIH